MTEQFRPGQEFHISRPPSFEASMSQRPPQQMSGDFHLTRQPANSTLNKSGDIFMAEGNQDQGQKPTPQPESSAKRQRLVREAPQGISREDLQNAWISFYPITGKEPLDELSTRETIIQEMVNQRRMPPVVRGGAEQIVREDFAAEPAFDNIIREVNERIALGHNQPLDPNYVRSLIDRVEGMRDRTDPILAINLLQRLQELQREGEQARQEEGARRQDREGQDREDDERIPPAVREFLEIINTPEIKAELIKLGNSDDPNENPDLTKPEMQRLLTFIDTKINPTEQNFMQVAQVLASLRTEMDRDGAIQISEVSKKLLFESILEEIISIPDEGAPDEHYSLGAFEVQNVKDKLLFLVNKTYSTTYPEFFTYLKELAHTRQIVHELLISFKVGEQYKKFISGELGVSGLHFIQNEVAGVNAVVRLYEKNLAQKVREKKTWLSEADIEDVNKDVEDQFESLARSGHATKNGRKLTVKERKRARRFADAYLAGIQRKAMYTALGNLPPDIYLASRIASIPYEPIARALMPNKVIAGRFYDAKGPRAYMNLGLAEQVKMAVQKGHPFLRLFGIDEKTMAMNANGAKDPESHSWRQRKMFLGAIKINLGNGQYQTLREFFNEKIHEHGGYEDETLGIAHLNDKDFSDDADVQDAVLGQTLYLSVLANYGNFTGDLKAKIWEKIACLKPSTIAALLPEVLNGREDVWESLKTKLYIAEEIRVQKEGETYEHGGYSKVQLHEEANKFRGTSYGFQTEEMIQEYFKDEFGNALTTDAERQLLLSIIRAGRAKSADLAKASIPYTFAIDDIAEIAWKPTDRGRSGISDMDLQRLMISDQDALGKGWGALDSFIESPNAVDRFIKGMTEAVNSIADVHGRVAAQEAIEPWIVAFLNFASKKPLIKWFPGAHSAARMGKHPTSQLEDYYRTIFISLDEHDKAYIVEALHQATVIGDDVKNREKGLTQLERIQKKTGSSHTKQMIRWLRLIIFLLGPAAGAEFLKSIVGKSATQAFAK